MLEKNIDDYWNVYGDRELSDTWTSFTILTILYGKRPDGKSWSGGETDKKANDLQTRFSVARNLERHVSSVKTKRVAKVGLSLLPRFYFLSSISLFALSPSSCLLSLLPSLFCSLFSLVFCSLFSPYFALSSPSLFCLSSPSLFCSLFSLFFSALSLFPLCLLALLSLCLLSLLSLFALSSPSLSSLSSCLVARLPGCPGCPAQNSTIVRSRTRAALVNLVLDFSAISAPTCSSSGQIGAGEGNLVQKRRRHCEHLEC